MGLISHTNSGKAAINGLSDQEEVAWFGFQRRGDALAWRRGRRLCYSAQKGPQISRVAVKHCNPTVNATASRQALNYGIEGGRMVWTEKDHPRGETAYTGWSGEGDTG